MHYGSNNLLADRHLADQLTLQSGETAKSTISAPPSSPLDLPHTYSNVLCTPTTWTDLSSSNLNDKHTNRLFFSLLFFIDFMVIAIYCVWWPWLQTLWLVFATSPFLPRIFAWRQRAID